MIVYVPKICLLNLSPTCLIINFIFNILGQYPVGGGAIRLFINGNTSTRYTAGIVQVFVNGQWSNICRKGSFSLTEAHVLCHQLGYSNALSWSYVAQTKM